MPCDPRNASLICAKRPWQYYVVNLLSFLVIRVIVTAESCNSRQHNRLSPYVALVSYVKAIKDPSAVTVTSDHPLRGPNYQWIHQVLAIWIRLSYQFDGLSL